MKTPDLEQEVLLTLERVLADVPWLKGVNAASKAGSESWGRDLTITLDRPGGKLTLLVEVKSNGEPRHVRDAVNSVLRRVMERPNTYAVIAAPYVSEGVGSICREQGVGYLDLAGNCYISAAGIHIVVTGRPRPPSAPREPRTLFAAKSSRVLRAMYAFPRKNWRVVELAREAGVSLGQVANVKKALEDKEWAMSTKDGLVLTKPEPLLRAWGTAYGKGRGTTRRFYSMAKVNDIEAAISELCIAKSIPYALSSFSAGQRIAPMVRYSVASAYVLGDIPAIATELELKEVGAGANVVLTAPRDDGELMYCQPVSGFNIVSPVQAYLDLQSNPARGEEAAEAILEQVIVSRW